jgi:hypothetical protein
MAQGNENLAEAKKLLQELNLLREKLGKEKLKLFDQDLLKIAKDLPGDIKSARKELEGMEDSMSGLYGSLRGVTSEFKGQASILNKVRGAFRQLEDIAQDLKFDEQEINDLNASQLKKLQQKFEKNSQIINQEARALMNHNNMAKSLEGLVDTLREQGKTQDEINDYVNDYLSNLKNKLTPEQESLLKLYHDQGNTIDLINKKIDQRIQKEKEINNALGVGGAAVQGISSLMNKLGMNSGIFSDAVQDAEEAMRDTAKDGGSKLQVLMAGLGPLAKGFGKALMDPAIIIDKIITGFLEVNKASVELERLTGQNSQAMAGANFEVATTVDTLKVAAELTQQLGINAQNAFSSDVLAGAAGLKNEMGLAADEAGGLAVMAQTTTGDINGMVDGIVDTTSGFNKANRAAVSQGQVLRDVAKTSDSIKLSLGNNPKAIAQAASAARRLGMELGDVDKIADSLLNFEDSISAELEAELLTGKQLNLEKARELALKNDLAGLGDELFKNSADIAEFGKMNRIQQEAYAKALGMTKDQLARIAYQKAIEKGMTDDQAAAAAGVTAEQMRQMDVQERISKALDKLAQAFAPILDIVADIADIIGGIITPIAGVVGYAVKFLDTLGLIKPLVIAMAVYFAGGAIARGIGSMVGGIRDFGKALKDINVSDFFNKFKEIKDSYLGGLAPKAAEAATTVAGGGVTESLTESLGDKAKETLEGKTQDALGGATEGAEKMGKGGNAQGFKEKMVNIAEGLKAFGNTKVLFGAFNLIPASIGLIAMIPGVGGAKLIEKLNGEKLKIGLEGLASGIGAMGTGKVFLGSLGLIAAAVGLTAMIPGAIGGLILGAAAPIIATGLNILGPALEGFGKVMMTGVGALGLAALLVAAIGLGYALNLAAPAIEAFGTVITSVFSGLATLVTAVAEGFVTMMGAVTMDSIGPMLLLGPALFGIAAGLGAVATAGLLALPAIGGLVLLSKAAPALVALGIGGKEEKTAGTAKKEGEGSMAALEAKFDTLIELVKQGTTINLDGTKIATSVGRNLPLVTTGTS